MSDYWAGAQQLMQESMSQNQLKSAPWLKTLEPPKHCREGDMALKPDHHPEPHSHKCPHTPQVKSQNNQVIDAKEKIVSQLVPS